MTYCWSRLYWPTCKKKTLYDMFAQRSRDNEREVTWERICGSQSRLNAPLPAAELPARLGQKKTRCQSEQIYQRPGARRVCLEWHCMAEDRKLGVDTLSACRDWIDGKRREIEEERN
jgi:hypothetical protein